MSSSSKAKKTEELKKKLFSPDETVVQAAITEARETGTIDIVAPLISLYTTTASEEIRKEVGEILGTIKMSGADEVFIEALTNPAFSSYRKDIIQFIWSSGIQPVNELANITRIAIDGSFEEALECITLLDSIETAIQEAVLLESITMVKQHLGHPGVDDKKALMTEYLRALENMIVED